MDLTPHLPLSNSLGFWLLRTANAIRLHHGDTLTCLEISLNQYLVMKAIAAKGSTQPSAVGKILGVNPSDATRISQKLEAKGLLHRSRSQADQRIVNLQLTQKGAEILRVAEGLIDTADRQARRYLTNDSVKELQNKLQEILRNCDRWDLEDI